MLLVLKSYHPLFASFHDHGNHYFEIIKIKKKIVEVGLLKVGNPGYGLD